MRVVVPGGRGEQRGPERANQSAEKVPVEVIVTLGSSDASSGLIKQWCPSHTLRRWESRRAAIKPYIGTLPETVPSAPTPMAAAEKDESRPSRATIPATSDVAQ